MVGSVDASQDTFMKECFGYLKDLTRKQRDQIGYDNDAEDMIIRMMILMMIMLILIITHVGIQVVGKMVLCSSRRSSRARKVPTT